jgi:predicted enzyme related to lactoylglutathione lyase
MADDIGQVIHFEVTGKDGKALQRYYGDLFGWNLNTNFPGGYGMTDRAETGIVVGVAGTQDGSAGLVTGYVRVADINATLAKAESLGGRTIMPRFSPDGTAYLALVADPEGHIVGLSE